MPNPLLHPSQGKSILLSTFCTLGMSHGGRGAHLRYLGETHHTRGETFQQWRWVGVSVDSHRLGDEVIICRGGISFITKPMSRDLVPRETCVTLFLGLVRTEHEQRILVTTEVVSQYVSGF